MRAAQQLLRALAADGWALQSLKSKTAALRDAPEQARVALCAAATDVQRRQYAVPAAQEAAAEADASGTDRQQGPGTAAAAAGSLEGGKTLGEVMHESAETRPGRDPSSTRGTQQRAPAAAGEPGAGAEERSRGPKQRGSRGPPPQHKGRSRRPATDKGAGKPRPEGGATAGGGRWWQRRGVPPQERPDRLVPVLMHHADTLDEVLEVVRHNLASITPRELTVAFRRMGLIQAAAVADEQQARRCAPPAGSAHDHRKEQCAQLFTLAQEHLPRLDSQALATAVWMCARFHYTPPPAERAAWEEAVWAVRCDANLIEIANIFFSLGVLHWAPKRAELLEELMDRALSGQAGGQLTPWVVCNVMWGCARLLNSNFHPGPDRLVHLMDAGLPQLGAFTSESFCAMLFSLACLRVRPDDAALTAVLDAFEWHVDKCSNRQLVTIVWSMGSLQIAPLVTEHLWERIERALLRQADTFNFSSAPLFLFGAARMGMAPSDTVLRLLLSKVDEHLEELRTGDVAVILWALPRLGFKIGDKLIDEALVQRLLDRFFSHNETHPATLRHISALLWALTAVKFRVAPATVRRLLDEAERLAAAGASPLTNTDANMLLAAFEALGSAEGLEFLKRHIIGGPDAGGDGLTDDDLDVRPAL